MPIDFSDVEMRTLCASPLFGGYTRKDVLGLLAQLNARRLAYANGAVVANEFEMPTKMAVLLSGFLHVYDSAFKGVRHLVRIVRPGEVLGATLAGVASRKAYPAFVRAHGDCVLVTLSLVDIDKLLKMGGGGILC